MKIGVHTYILLLNLLNCSAVRHLYSGQKKIENNDYNNFAQIITKGT